MIWGMSLETFTFVHVLISLVGIASGFIVMFGMLSGKRLNGWTALFLATTVATSVTGFGFPFHGWTPPYTFGVVSLVVLTIAILARYTFHLNGKWNRTYIITAAISLYLNAFVAIVQAFLKIPSLKAIAPKQTEPPFLIAQLLFLALFVALTIAVAIRFPKRSLTVA